VRKELKALLCERERAAIAEIRQAIHQIQGQARLAQLAQESDVQASKRVGELVEKESQGLPTEAEMNLARRDHIKTRTDVLHEAILWELARVDLRRAQGLLVREVLDHKDGEVKPGGCCR
jgi:hypothetical protein